MTLSSRSDLTYADLAPIMDRAVQAPNGIRIPFETKNEAVRYRLRCNDYRVYDRKRNQHIYPPGNPMHGSSVFDTMVLRIEQENDQWYVIFSKKVTIDEDKIEYL